MAELHKAGLTRRRDAGQGRAADLPGLRRPEPGAAGQEHRRHDAVRAAIVAGHQQGLRRRGDQALRHADRRAGAHHGHDREVLQGEAAAGREVHALLRGGHQDLHRQQGGGREIRARGGVQGPDHEDDFDDAISNSPYTYDITPEHIQITTDIMVKTGVGRMAKPPVARDWVKTDLLDAAKKSLGVK